MLKVVTLLSTLRDPTQVRRRLCATRHIKKRVLMDNFFCKNLHLVGCASPWLKSVVMQKYLSLFCCAMGKNWPTVVSAIFTTISLEIDSCGVSSFGIQSKIVYTLTWHSWQLTSCLILKLPSTSL